MFARESDRQAETWRERGMQADRYVGSRADRDRLQRLCDLVCKRDKHAGRQGERGMQVDRHVGRKTETHYRD